MKRKYLIISLVTALGLSLAYAEVAAGQKDRESDKAGQNRDRADVESSVFSFPLTVGEDSYLGVYLEEVTSDRVKELGLKEERGAVVMKVVEGSPAEKAGIKENDVIVSFNGRRVDSVRELQRLRSETPAGRTVAIEVIRGGNQLTLNATLSKRRNNAFVFRPDGSFGSGQSLSRIFPRHNKELEDLLKGQLPDFGTFNFSFPYAFGSYRGTRLGVSVETISDQLAEYFGVKTKQGLLITEVIENTPASRAGLRAGDVIVAVDNKNIESINTLLNAINEKEEGPLTLTIVRDKAEQTVTVTLERRAPRPSTRSRFTTVSTSTSAV